MAATGFTPISLYYSTTAATAPSGANLVAGELALNTLDEKLYFKNSTGTVKLLASSAVTGTVTSVAQSFTGGIVSVAGSPITTTGTLALTVAGTSGGIPYFSSASTWATSAALAASSLVVGGGAGAAPATVTTGANVVTALGVAVGSAGAFVVNGGALGTPSSGVISACTSTGQVLTNPTVTNYTETLQAVGTVGASSTLALTTGTVLTATLTASTPCTFTMPTATAGKSFILILTQAATGMTTATFTGVKYPGGTAPTITATASAVDTISFVSNGTVWYGTYAQAFA
jgi:hypothetical protein